MKPRMITIAIMALGGQGGGVLEDWITTLAEDAGWTAQATSVAGVAQRTGATIYYIEMVEPTPGQTPVLAQMPIPGQVDILIAAELMEAGRAVARGLVTPNRTTVITSTHRTYAVQEKVMPGDGAADSAGVLELVRKASRRTVADDMQRLAVEHGSMISASLFGALAGCDVLPFRQLAFEQVVERGGKGAQASLATLRAAAELARTRPAPPALAARAQAMKTPARPLPDKAASAALAPLLARIRSAFPPAAWDWLGEGLARVVDWQDVAYGAEYLDNVARFAGRDPQPETAELTIAAAHWIAVAMSYDDVIRVANLKTRADRFARIRAEVGGAAGDVFGMEEYFHPRLEEVMGMLPVKWADWLDRSPRLKAWIGPRLNKGRRIRTHTFKGHLQLHIVAGLARWRRGNRRHAEEQAHWHAWMAIAERALDAGDAPLATEILRCRQLIKGYSDTHARGEGKFDRLMYAVPQLAGQPDAARKLASLLQAARLDPNGKALSEREAELDIRRPVAAA
ncbi:MAG: indolepyruvate oxidoreductase subunit beta family protein [Comamonadaceae bacterium]|nr:indolepyruvate oxidoreductase subunit beta family protein [Burkholderiales bacterium]MEB2347117.1 indolepyruvate oxidoreductase subunit beta family protein [Comamonadaceae bacterium]